MGRPARQPINAAPAAPRRDVWQPIADVHGVRTLGDLVGAARAVALTGGLRDGVLGGACGSVVHHRLIEGVSYAADPHGHAVEVTMEGRLVLARWRDAAARMVHLERHGCRQLINRHYRLAHLLQPGRLWMQSHRGDQVSALVVVESIEGVRVRLRRVSSGLRTSARIERFDGRPVGYHPISDELAEEAMARLGLPGGQPR